jgi:hypothetical protein
MNKKTAVVVGLLGGVGLVYLLTRKKAGASTIAEIAGQTREANCSILPGVTVTAYLSEVEQGSAISDADGNYLLSLPSGTYDIVASKPGFRNMTQSISVKSTYTLDFIGDHGLIPNVPDLSYVLACANLWEFGAPPCQLSESTVLAVTNAWENPI